MWRSWIFIGLFLSSFVVFSQEIEPDSSLILHRGFKSDTTLERNKYCDSISDKYFSDTVRLKEVNVISRLKFNSSKERYQYLILQRKVRRVWPYVTLAADRLSSLEERLDSLPKRKKKPYTRMVQRYMEGKFKKQLKKLTRSEGQIMVKLIYRQTGRTTYDIVKDLRSGFNAFFYNAGAHLFSISLKRKYDPMTVQEDYYIEHILLANFQSGRLKMQDPAIKFDFFKAAEKWEQQRKQKRKEIHRVQLKSAN